MKPKLIVLNGPLGIGKSTLAVRYGKDHPLTLRLDIDDIWAMFSHWREERDIAVPLSKKIALEMARLTLQSGHDVIVPQIIQTAELADGLASIALECGSSYYEIMLVTGKDESIRRFIERGKNQGYPDGFRTGGTIDTDGREKKLAEMYDNMIEVSGKRPRTIKIESVEGNIEHTYAQILKAVNED